MATTYKTPGAYVEEITKFPPSVAQVETAIPAFIGYTEKATKKIENDLDQVPTRISSLLEYQNYFGSAYPETSISIDITDILLDGSLQRDVVVHQPSSPKPFLMYYALQMYFANGGGPCYIVSINKYEGDDNSENNITFDDLNAGLDLLKSEDEPTLIVFPDAKELSEADFYTLYNNALTQCHDMQDRFAIIDTHTSVDSFDDAEIARNGLNLEKDYLKYGAVYYPYLETILDYKYEAADVFINHVSYDADAIPVAIDELITSKTKLVSAISEIRTISDLGLVAGVDDSVVGSLADVRLFIEVAAGFNNAGPGDFSTSKRTTFVENQLKDLIEDLKNLVSIKETIKTASNSAKASVDDENPGGPFSVAIGSTLKLFTDLFEEADTVESVLTNLIDLSDKLTKAKTETAIKNIIVDNTTKNVIDEVEKLFSYSPIQSTPTEPLTVADPIFSNMEAFLNDVIDAVNDGSSIDINNGSMNGRSLENIETTDNALYNKIKAEISNLPLTLPPSSAMAGIYARVDSDRGVWKAPANVGVKYVIKPTIKITNNEQDSLNIDTVAGKSINAIRSFTGKGTLVWGSRTLAGNDNEWRYVPVRRFFNMAEESIKKATEQFVFEPNDANTWVRVRAMIENFLTLQWRAGALAGAKPEQAFYVKVGLGQTMSALDILEGRMIIEIGMAVVRPAEFIILRFSHLMQES